MANAKDTLAIGTTDATDTPIQSKDVTAEYGRFATLNNPGIPPTEPRQQVAMFTQLLEDCERYRQPYELEWMRLFSQYHGSTETEGKAAWQSKVHVALSKRDVDTLASKIVSIVFSEEGWFDILPSSRAQDYLKDIAMKTIQQKLHVGRYREPVETSIKDALICGNGPMKVTQEKMLKAQMIPDYQAGPPTYGPDGQVNGFSKGKYRMKRGMKEVSSLQMRPVIPTDFWLDPSGQNRFVFHRSKRHLSDLWKLTKPQIDPATGVEIMPAIYNADEVAKIRPGSRDRKLDQFASVIRRERYLAYEDMTVDVYEIWGDIPDPSTGVTLWPNCFATFVDKQWLLRPPQENPWWHQRIPFIDFRSMLNPHQLYGYGFLMQGSPLQAEIDRVTQLVVDKVSLSVGMVEADTSAARNSEDFGGSHLKVDPARIFTRKGERQIFTPVKLTEGPTPADMQVLEMLQRFYEMTTSVNEFTTGQNQTTTRKTKAEVEIKASASQSQFSDIGQYMEEHSLSPFIQMIWELSIQFDGGNLNPKLLDMFSDSPQAQQLLIAFSQMPAEERWAKMNLEAEFRVDGITRSVTRQQRLDRLVNLIKLFSGDPVMGAIIDKRVIAQEVMDDLQMPRTIIMDDADAILQQAMAATLQNIEMQLSGQAPPPGQGGPPNGGPPQGPQQQQNQQAQMPPHGPPQ
jgi:hypothetical protein